MGDQDSNNQVITIDSEISRILGLEDNFDLDPDEYLQLVRAKLVEYDILAGSKNITSEQQEEQRILASQVREIREQKRTAEVKYTTGKVSKKINADAFFNRKSEEVKKPEKRIVDPSKLLPGTAKTGEIVKYKTQRVEDLKREKPEEEGKELTSILSILDSILNTLKNQFKFNQKKTEEGRKEKERKKREKKEEGLEKGFAMVKGAVKKMLAPFQSILDRIFKFFFFTFLGKMFTDLMNWLSDPKNKKKVEVLGRFLKDWWPLLLGAYLMFASPLGLFIRGSLKMIGGLTSQILKLLPRLLKVSKGLVTSGPARAAGRAVLGAGRFLLGTPQGLALTATAVGSYVRGKEVERIKPSVEQDRKEADKTLQSKESPWYQKLGAYFAKQQLTGPRGPSDPVGAPVPGAMYSEGGVIRGYSDGAIIDHGYNGIDSNTGISVTGAGRDTQVIVAREGEVVLTPEDAGVIQERTGFDVYDYVKNRKPAYTNFNKIKTTGGIPLASVGGILGFNKGGSVVGGSGRVPGFNKGGSVVGGSGRVPGFNKGGVVGGSGRVPGFNKGGVVGGSGRVSDNKEELTRLQGGGGVFGGAVRLWNNITSGFAPQRRREKMGPQLTPNIIQGALRRQPQELTKSAKSLQKDKWSYASRGGDAKNGCAPAINEVYKRAGIPTPWANVRRPNYVPDIYSSLSKKYSRVSEDQRKPGDIVIWRDTGYPPGSGQEPYGHIGMVMPDGRIANNSTSKGTFTNLNTPQEAKSWWPNTQELIYFRNPSIAARPQVVANKGSDKNLRGNNNSFRPQSVFANLIPSVGGNRFRLPIRSFQGGGSITPITTKTGIPTSKMNIEAGADTQYLPQYNVAVQPGEQLFKYVLPKESVEKGAGGKLLQLAQQVVADTDSNSNAAKLGFRNKSINIKPPPNRLNNSMMLPPIKTSSSGGIKGAATTNSQDFISFSPVLETSNAVRKMHVDMYGILD